MLIKPQGPKRTSSLQNSSINLFINEKSKFFKEKKYNNQFFVETLSNYVISEIILYEM